MYEQLRKQATDNEVRFYDQLNVQPAEGMIFIVSNTYSKLLPQVL